MSEVRLVVVAKDLAYPPPDGGQAEVWGRLEAWRRLGAELHVVNWVTSRRGQAGTHDECQKAGIGYTPVRRRRSLRSLLQQRLPPMAASMSLSNRLLADLVWQLGVFAPTAVVLENWPASDSAFRIASELQVPLLYRAQNMEAEYWRQVHAASTGLQRVRYGLTARRIARLERVVRMAASAVMDITPEDLQEARAMGLAGRATVLPPVWRGVVTRAYESGSLDTDVDFLFGGSLWPPHHVEGVRWLLQSVLPAIRVKSERPVSLRIIGANPTEVVRQLARDSAVELRPNVADFSAEICRARVLLNPVQRSSGINMKMLDFIASGRPVVSTSAGARGLLREVRACTRIVDDPEQFAATALDSLRSSSQLVGANPSGVIDAAYGDDPQRAFLDTVRSGSLTVAGQLS